MKTKNGIYLDLAESEYYVETKDYIIKFSSEKYKEKFENGYEDYVNEEIIKFRIKYKTLITNELQIELEKHFIRAYYEKIETRGRYIKIKK